MSCRCHLVLDPLERNVGASLASGSEVTALSKWKCAVSRREHELAMVQSFRWSQDLANVAAGEQVRGKNTVPCGGRADKCQNFGRNSVDDASTLKPSCIRGFRVCKKPSKVEVVKREHRNVGPRISSHNICLKDVRGELPIGSVARKISEGSSDVRLECRTRAVRICKAALRRPWIHSRHCSVDGDLRWSCSKCGKKLQSLNGCFPIYRGRNPCASSDHHLCWRSVPKLFEIWDTCCLETPAPRDSVLRQRSWLGPRRLRFVGDVRRLLTGLVHTVDGVFLKNPHERGCLRSSMLGRMARCCKRRKHLFVMIFGKQRCEAAARNSRELLMALWNERRPECASVDRERPRVGRQPLHVLQLGCIVVLFVTNDSTPVRLVFCLAGQLRVTHLRMILCTLPIMVVLSGICAPLGLRRRWNITKEDAPAERVVRIWHRVCLKRGLSGAEEENPLWCFGMSSRWLGTAKIFLCFSSRNPHVSSFCRRPALHRMSLGR